MQFGTEERTSEATESHVVARRSELNLRAEAAALQWELALYGVHPPRCAW